MVKKIGYILTSVLSLLFVACAGGSCNVVPNRSFTTNINQSEHLGVYATNGWAYAGGGYAGLVVYNSGTQTNPKLLAYDRCSTINPEAGNKVEVEGLTLIDRASGARWLMLDGSPIEIAECPLKPYAVGQNGSIFYVQN
ncbi:hypothetical protein PQ465_01925 [Sphingobacterium oryzagri]|uniref:Lipoprotein n=1 Tax=Sphingobacterium oryzagri TaxID=3025669 RepID=A0ABY7WJJ0_9SPHI|nr:hypothetical protein [Sphingobacterium sp. KACC 22765]WDF69150.1 hypothetical protein PQ465_01925 [Sphingobacterium sp. KACC 22765]